MSHTIQFNTALNNDALYYTISLNKIVCHVFYVHYWLPCRRIPSSPRHLRTTSTPTPCTSTLYGPSYAMLHIAFWCALSVSKLLEYLLSLFDYYLSFFKYRIKKEPSAARMMKKATMTVKMTRARTRARTTRKTYAWVEPFKYIYFKLRFKIIDDSVVPWNYTTWLIVV